ncbi:formamidopyrimidine-DNA glycosylase [Amylibacter marinus]|uniref:Formamidopyrimidine-DNA glycosylase n=1 Tax=Amylibacter marinus TaxID=1475483 RepID=A0ABQ5VWT6_9RHOB|nr:bifunctional DNA-formamidopyrimidine glycosylase/DNA-(apurinic or apyrimidinic site) lyase [Amylibacter marinus]GLQ35669.1 formamidopyrimidine-DNA glycosylase [Amylibacter marinus]
MPELPEVETVRRGLTPAMQGQVIARADIRRPDLRWPFPDNMAARLIGARVDSLRRRSKYILLDLDRGETLLIHLGMSGRMIIAPPTPTPQDPAKHDHVVLDMANGTRISFNDPRRFGAMDLIDTKTLDQHKLIKNIGPEPLGNAFNDSYLFENLSRRKSPIKTALLDQGLVAGLGNIYVCEVLWRAGIHPTTRCTDITQAQASALVPIIRTVLSEAIEAGGSSLRDHRQTNGDLGYFQHSFAVYGREGEKCRTENCADSILRLVQAGRSSFFCPNCQKTP